MSASARRLDSDDSFVLIDPTDILSVKLSESHSKHHLHTDRQPSQDEVQGQMSPISKRTDPMSLQSFQKYIDTDGRLVDESTLRRSVFLGGVEPGARREVWQYLFSLYPCSSTKREREVLLLDYIVKYNEMKSRWKTLLVLSAKPGATPFEQGLVARYQLDESKNALKSPDLDVNNPFIDSQNVNIEAAHTSGLESDFNALSNNCKFLNLNSQETKQKIEFMKIQAQVFVNRTKIDVIEMKKCLRLIDKDVPRTDRDVPYFSDMLFWSSLGGLPRKCKWPVKVIEWRAGGDESKVLVYCHSDKAYFKVQRSQLIPFPGEFEKIKERGIAALRKRKDTAKEFLLDIKWAEEEHQYTEREVEGIDQHNLHVQELMQAEMLCKQGAQVNPKHGNKGELKECIPVEAVRKESFQADFDHQESESVKSECIDCHQQNSYTAGADSIDCHQQNSCQAEADSHQQNSFPAEADSIDQHNSFPIEADSIDCHQQNSFPAEADSIDCHQQNSFPTEADSIDCHQQNSFPTEADSIDCHQQNSFPTETDSIDCHQQNSIPARADSIDCHQQNSLPAEADSIDCHQQNSFPAGAVCHQQNSLPIEVDSLQQNSLPIEVDSLQQNSFQAEADYHLQNSFPAEVDCHQHDSFPAEANPLDDSIDWQQLNFFPAEFDSIDCHQHNSCRAEADSIDCYQQNFQTELDHEKCKSVKLECHVCDQQEPFQSVSGHTDGDQPESSLTEVVSKQKVNVSSQQSDCELQQSCRAEGASKEKGLVMYEHMDTDDRQESTNKRLKKRKSPVTAVKFKRRRLEINTGNCTSYSESSDTCSDDSVRDKDYIPGKEMSSSSTDDKCSDNDSYQVAKKKVMTGKHYSHCKKITRCRNKMQIRTNSNSGNETDSEYVSDSASDSECSTEYDDDTSMLFPPRQMARKRIPADRTYDKINKKIYIKKVLKSRTGTHGQMKKSSTVWNQVHACTFCKEVRSNIAKHLRKHDKPEVKEVLDLSKKLGPKHKDVKARWDILRNTGDNSNNKRVLKEGSGEIILGRRVKEGCFNIDQYGPCPGCLVWIKLDKTMRFHQKHCPAVILGLSNCSKKSSNELRILSLLEAGKINSVASRGLREEVFTIMKNDDVSKTAQNDPLIVSLGNMWLLKNIGNKLKRKYYTSQRMRDAARLLLNLQIQTRVIKPLYHFLNPVFFEDVVKATLTTASPDFDDEEDLKSPSTAIKLGYDIKRLTGAKWAMCLKSRDKEEVENCNDFLKLMQIEWSLRVSKIAQVTLQTRRFNQVKKLPNPDDLVCIQKHIRDELNELKFKDGQTSFRRAIELCQGRLLLYNKRRSGELDGMTVKQYVRRTTGVSDIEKCMRSELSVLEMHLLKTQDLIETRGKGGRGVPVIIPKDVKTALRYISNAQNRHECGIHPDNPYLFPNTKLGAIRSYDSLKKMCQEVQLKQPEQITSVNLRKYTATVSQIFDLNNHQQQWLLNHMGHSLDVHKIHYRQTSGVIERVDIAKMMLLQEYNLVGKYAGKKLDSIDLNEIVFHSSEPEHLDVIPSDISETDVAPLDGCVTTDDEVQPDLQNADTFDEYDFMDDDAEADGAERPKHKQTRSRSQGTLDTGSSQLSMLRDILITYAAFTPEVGYAQGMNDILARFLFVFDSEVEAFWCFHNYLEKIKRDFLEEGMIQKIELVRKLLLEMDPLLLQHLEKHDLGDLLFCHRWLLLGFKREFSFMDSLRVFEILSSHHLELSSIEAETARRKQAMKEFVKLGGVNRTAPMETDAEFTFELFMCVVLLQNCRDRLFKCVDAAMVFECINSLEINLDSVLEKSEHLFFRYCKKTVEDSFQMVEVAVKR